MFTEKNSEIEKNCQADKQYVVPAQENRVFWQVVSQANEIAASEHLQKKILQKDTVPAIKKNCI